VPHRLLKEAQKWGLRAVRRRERKGRNGVIGYRRSASKGF